MVGTRSVDRKDEKGLGMPPFMAMSRFWGFPIGLMALQMVTEKARARSSIFAETFWVLA